MARGPRPPPRRHLPRPRRRLAALLTPRILAITPPTPGPWVDELHWLAPAGVDGLIIRLTEAPGALPAVLARLPPRLAVLVRPVAPGDADRALDAGLGLHLPAAVPPAPWRRRQPGLLSAACHNQQELTRAAAAGVDFALLSPVFSPGSKPDDTRPTLGLAGFSALAASVAPLPVLALGGVTPALRVAGAAGIASISAFFRAGRVVVPAHSEKTD